MLCGAVKSAIPSYRRISGGEQLLSPAIKDFKVLQSTAYRYNFQEIVSPVVVRCKCSRYIDIRTYVNFYPDVIVFNTAFFVCKLYIERLIIAQGCKRI